jgi:GT2 family glycosyltransferase
MITLTDISILIVSAAKSIPRLESVYKHTRDQYPDNEIVIVYDDISEKVLNVEDPNLIQVTTDKRVYVSVGYNLAMKHSTKSCFVFLHDDTYTAPNFLENLIPHIKKDTFVNFVQIEPPKFHTTSTLQKPIKDLGSNESEFDKNELDKFYHEHIPNLPHNVEPAPFGGFFMSGYKDSFLSVGGFDEEFQPYFFEDSDLMVRLHIEGYRFALVLDSLVYHMGSLTSRGTAESDIAHSTTQNIFLKKWKTTFDIIKEYTMLNGFEYKKPSLDITLHNPNKNLQNVVDIFNSPEGDIEVHINGDKFNQQDVDYLLLFPYIIKGLEYGEVYEIGNLRVNIKQKNKDGIKII